MKQARRRRWTLPAVPPYVARRRRIFFLGVLTVAGVAICGSTSAMLTRSSPAHAEAAAAGDRQGCTLLVNGRAVDLSDGLAMTLTDIAGRDQNAAAPLSHTAAAAVAAWPAQSASAEGLALALRGYVPGALACTAELPQAARQTMLPDGLTPRASTMWDAVKVIFGELPAGGFMPGGVQSGHMPGSAHYEGRAIDFLYRPITPKSIRHGWVLAQWLEAHAAELQIAHVIFDDRIWAPGDSASRGWRPYADPEGPTTNPTLLHVDHVHADVQRGS